MYGLDKNEDLAFLLNKTLIQVCIGEYQVQLKFHEDGNISSMGAITVDERYFESPKEAGIFMVQSLGSTVIETVNPVDGNLTLVFSSGQKVILHDDDKHYESYTISATGKLIIV